MEEHEQLRLRQRLEGIAGRLGRLRELDPPQPQASNPLGPGPGGRRERHVMFGADLHAYRSRPLPEERLLALERKAGCALPGEFRAFLAAIGVGAGPYYGVDEAWLERAATTHCARPFPDGERGPIYLDEAGDEEVEDGFLVITDIGCGDLVGLVTAGPAAGRVVFLIYQRDEWSLGPGFLDYLEQWLERGIERLGAEPRPTTVA